MKREEKSALSRQRIIDAAMEEFSQKGYAAASLNTVWAEKGISKGIIYHYFQDKDQLYLLCVETCFQALTDYLQAAAKSLTGPIAAQLQSYFDARLRFFGENPRYLGIFADVSFHPPAHLRSRIAALRQSFDALNISVLKSLLNSAPMRHGLSVDTIVEDFRVYMDYFNIHFSSTYDPTKSQAELLQEHELRCHRQLDILLYGVLGS